jgi:uncharacterized protein (TIGR00297 family)
MTLPLRLVTAIAISAAIGIIAYWRRSLSESGLAGAIIVGTATLAFGGWAWGILLAAFFVLSSVLSHYRIEAKRDLAEKFAKGGRRDVGQTLANGGAGAMLAIAHAVWPDPLFWAAFIGAMATVNADTWATELGVLSTRRPRLLTTWQEVETGTSGAISPLGSLATVGGATTIGLGAALITAVEGLLAGAGGPAASLLTRKAAAPLLVAMVGGTVGSLLDSLLGATVQAAYYSESRAKVTERRVNPDGSPNRHVRGWRWMTNDAVNLISSLVGALAAGLCWYWLTSP